MAKKAKRKAKASTKRQSRKQSNGGVMARLDVLAAAITELEERVNALDALVPKPGNEQPPSDAGEPADASVEQSG